MEKIAGYLLEEQNFENKVQMLHYLKKKMDFFFDNSVVFKSQLARMFIEEMNIDDVDKNLVITACLLYDCKKKDVAVNLEEIKAFPLESAKLLRELGFDEKFCKICIQHNRNVDMGPREKESDILELVDQFGGMLLHRPERRGFTVEDALCLLEHRNLKEKENVYLHKFLEFINKMEEIKI